MIECPLCQASCSVGGYTKSIPGLGEADIVCPNHGVIGWRDKDYGDNHFHVEPEKPKKHWLNRVS